VSQVTWLLIAEMLWVSGLCAWIVMERRSPQATLAWIMGLVWLPYVGIVVYLLIGPRRLTRKRRRYAMARARSEQIADHGPGSGAAELPSLDPEVRQLSEMVVRAGGTPPSRTDRVDVLLDGDACFDAIEVAIREARHHVHLEYYIWEPDTVGRRFRDLLCEKARAGVHVRLLLDAIGSSSLGRRFLAPLVEAGGQVAWFNRLSFSRFRPGWLNFRTHRKIVVCDGRVGFTGGINICDEHAASLSGKRAWRDTHARLEGSAVHYLQRVFLDDWYFATGAGPTHAEYFPCARTAEERDVPCTDERPTEAGQCVSSGSSHRPAALPPDGTNPNVREVLHEDKRPTEAGQREPSGSSHRPAALPPKDPEVVDQDERPTEAGQREPSGSSHRPAAPPPKDPEVVDQDERPTEAGQREPSGSSHRPAALPPGSSHRPAALPPVPPWVQVVASGPDTDRYPIHKLYFAAIAGAQRRVLLTTPYFVPDEAILSALVTAAMRGVDVRVLLPHRTDSWLVTAAARSYFDDLRRAGTHIYEFGPHMIHAKTLVVDDHAFLGTANMDNRSFRLNFEVLVAIYDKAIANRLADAFEADLRWAVPYTKRVAGRIPFHQRLVQSAARLFAPLL